MKQQFMTLHDKMEMKTSVGSAHTVVVEELH